MNEVVTAAVCASMLQLEERLTLHQHLNDLVDLALVMMKALDEINNDSFQNFKLRIGKDVVLFVQFHAFQALSVAKFVGSETLWMF